MNARYYVPSLNRFASADTIVPDPGNPQALNRFSYVGNNAVNANDPTGHCASDDQACWDYLNGEGLYADGKGFCGGGVCEDWMTWVIAGSGSIWTIAELEVLRLGLSDVIAGFGGQTNAIKAFQGKRFRRQTDPYETTWDTSDVNKITAAQYCAGDAASACLPEFANNIILYDRWANTAGISEYDKYTEDTRRWIIIHEMGHAFDGLTFQLSAGLGDYLTYKDWFFGDPTYHPLSEYDSSFNTLERRQREAFSQAFAATLFQGNVENVRPEFQPYQSQFLLWKWNTKPVNLGIEYVESLLPD